jgi:hypothetical protein
MTRPLKQAGRAAYKVARALEDADAASRGLRPYAKRRAMRPVRRAAMSGPGGQLIVVILIVLFLIWLL